VLGTCDRAIQALAGMTKKAVKSFVVECCLGPFKLLHATTGKSEFVKSLRTGSRIILNPSQKIQFIQWVKPAYEPHILHLAKRVLEPGDLAIDIGAHVGYWTLVFSDLVGPGGRVVSIEPESANYLRLTRNLSFNRKTETTIPVHAALSDKDTVGTLSICDHNEGGHYVTPTADVGGGPQQEIQLRTLDGILSEVRSLPRCKLLKMDVEGHEVPALRGMVQLLSGPHPPSHMIVEAAKGNVPSREGVFRLLTGYGYRCRNIFHPDQSAEVMQGGADMYFSLPS